MIKRTYFAVADIYEKSGNDHIKKEQANLLFEFNSLFPKPELAFKYVKGRFENDASDNEKVVMITFNRC